LWQHVGVQKLSGFGALRISNFWIRDALFVLATKGSLNNDTNPKFPSSPETMV
jgi:hypothetical protein